MKRYWVFGGVNFYPQGGMQDFLASFDCLKDAISFALDFEVTRAEQDSDGACGVWWNIADSVEHTMLSWQDVRPMG